MKVDQIYGWVISYFERKSSITENTLKEELGPEDVEHALLLLRYLVSKKLISFKVLGTGREYTTINLDKIKQLVGYEKEELKPSEEESIELKHEFLVVNVPLSLSNDLNRIIRKYDNLHILTMRKAFKLLFDLAKNELLLSLPFFEFDGLTYFIDEIQSLARRGVSIRLLSRDILTAKEGYTHITKLRALSKMIDLFESNKLSPKNKLEIREFGTRLSDTDIISIHYEGIHQKMIVADKKYAYVGSGEIRAASFLMNGDVGVIHTGKNAEFWGEFFDVFWKNAQAVPYEFIARSIR